MHIKERKVDTPLFLWRIFTSERDFFSDVAGWDAFQNPPISF